MADTASITAKKVLTRSEEWERIEDLLMSDNPMFAWLRHSLEVQQHHYRKRPSSSESPSMVPTPARHPSPCNGNAMEAEGSETLGCTNGEKPKPPALPMCYDYEPVANNVKWICHLIQELLVLEEMFRF